MSSADLNKDSLTKEGEEENKEARWFGVRHYIDRK
jgi:hypothetical protein